MVHRVFKAATIAVCAFVAANCGGSDSSTSDGPTQPAAPAQPSAEALAIQAKIDALPAPYNEADYQKGRRQFAKCRACHLVNASGGHRIGPNLSGIFGSQIGTAEGFNYSDVLLEADFVWTPEQLDQWLANPREFLPGNLMNFAGVANEGQRRDLLAYLMVETAVEEAPEAP